MRTRLVLGAGALVGAAAAAGIAHALVLLHPPPSPPPAPVAPTTIMVPPPLVVTIEKTVPPSSPVVPADDLGCSVPRASDLAIGRAIDPADVADAEATDHPPPRVAVARSARQLAVLHEGGLWVSDDDGRSFARILDDHTFSDIAVAPDGVIYGLEAERIAVRAPSGAVTWRAFAACEPGARCDRRIATNGRELVGFVDETLTTSTDQGRTWKVIRDPEFSWWDHRGALFSWRGALYQVLHYSDQCGVDDNFVFRLDADHRIAHDIFHDYPSADAPILRASTDVATTWTWTERCWTDDDTVGRCKKPVAARRELLQAATLRPAEGGRTLAVFEGGLVELCARGARQIYRAFPLRAIEAVDAAGRPLGWKGTTLLRWSPLHGWRALKTFTPSVVPDAAR